MKIKLPLTYWTNGRKLMSGVVDGDGTLLAGSFICQQSVPKCIDFHQRAVEAVNEHATLVAVAEAAHGLMMTPGVEKFDVAHYKVAKAISTLAAVRAGQPLPPAPQDQVLVEALIGIASWGEGDEVDGSFDEPCAAKTARDALAKIGIVGGSK
jgi:hypothetical protein